MMTYDLKICPRTAASESFEMAPPEGFFLGSRSFNAMDTFAVRAVFLFGAPVFFMASLLSFILRFSWSSIPAVEKHLPCQFFGQTTRSGGRG